MKQHIHTSLSLLATLLIASVLPGYSLQAADFDYPFLFQGGCSWWNGPNNTDKNARECANENMARCLASHPICKEETRSIPEAGYQRIYYEIWAYGECEDRVSFEPGGPPVDDACPQSCVPGYVQTEAPYNPNAGTPYSTGYDCMRNREPDECKFLGKYEVETQFGAYCVEQCAGIGDDGLCIDEVQKDPDEPQCSTDHPEYKGVAGYGGEAVYICGDPQNNCKALGDGYTWGVVEKDGTVVESCFPNSYNPPKCSGTDILKRDQWGGFACLPLRTPDEDPTPGSEDDPNNGDSDGDGQGDLTGITGQLQDIKKLLGGGNRNTNNINETLKGLGKQIKDGTKAITDAIGNIPGGGGNGNGNGDGDGDSEEPPINWSGDPIELEISDGLEELNAIQGEYENLIANIRSEMASSFGSFTGGGGLEDNNVTLYGETFNAGLSKFGAHLSIVGSIILFAAAFIGLGIVMGAKD